MGLTFVDLFCGIGTIRMGMEQAGHECVYSVEWDKHKRKIYSIIFGGEPEGADIREVRAIDIPRADLWCFGAPCQDFSIAGKRAGLDGGRSSLVSEVFRLIRETPEEHRPKYILYENVKGMLSSNKGFDYLEILYQMGEIGYDTEREVPNSREYGLPQNRERVFTLGHLRGRSTGKVFPIDGTGNETGMDINILAHRKGYRRNTQVYDVNGSIETLDTCQGGGRQPHILVKAVGQVSPKGSQAGKVYDTEGIFPTICAETHGYANGYIKMRETDRIRRLIPRECWRLQGIPDEITDKVIRAKVSDTQMYRGAGDACTVNVIYEIAKKLT